MIEIDLSNKIAAIFAYLYMSFVVLGGFTVALTLALGPVILIGKLAFTAYVDMKGKILPWGYIKYLVALHGDPKYSKFFGLRYMVHNDPDRALNEFGNELISFAKQHGRTITISMEKPWYTRPAIGASAMVLDVRKSHKQYRQEAEKADD